MAYPTTLDDFTPHVDGVDEIMALDVNELQAAIEAIEAKLGIDNSADTGSIDYKLAQKAPLTSPTFGTSITGSYLTASEMLGTDASKNIISLPVATYPSLTELSYVKGVTSGIQSQLNGKQASGSYELSTNKVTSISGASTDTQYPSAKLVYDQLALKAALISPTFATSITGSYLTASEMLITDADKKIVSAPVATYPSLTELSYIKGLSSAIQTQLNAKAPSANPTFTGTVILPKTLEIQDTSADHQYVLAVSELTADRTVTLPLLTGNDTFVFQAHTQTLTNKRINSRLVTAASYTTDTGTSLDVSTCDQFEITAQAGALLFNAPSGTPTGGQKLIIRIKDNGTARALTYNAVFRAMGNALPTTTVVSKTLYMGFIYNATDTKWDLVAVAQEA
jgi:hypothetical protein